MDGEGLEVRLMEVWIVRVGGEVDGEGLKVRWMVRGWR